MSQVDPASESKELAGTPNGGPTGTALATIDNQQHGVPAVGWSYGPPQRPEILSANPNPFDLMHAMRRRWPLAVGIGSAVGLTAALLVWFLVPVKYEAFALLRVAEKPGGVLDKSRDARDVFDLFKRTQAQYVVSGPVVRKTIREPSIARLATIKDHDDDPESWLSDQIMVDYPNDAELMRVAIKTEYKDESIKLVDMIVKMYLDEVVHNTQLERFAQEDKLKEKYKTISDEYSRKNEQLFKSEQVNQVETTAAAQMKRQVAERSLFDSLVQHHTLQREIQATEMEIAIMKARESDPEANTVPDVMIEAELRRDPTVSNLTNMKSTYTTMLARVMTVTVNPALSSEVRQLNALINEIDLQIEQYKADARPHVIEMLAAEEALDRRGGMGGTTLTSLETKRNHLTDLLTAAKQEIDDKSKGFENSQEFSADVETRREELKALRDIMTKLKSQIDLTEVERLAKERIEKLDDAQLDSVSGDAIRKYVGVLFAGVLGFAAVMVGIAFVEFQSRKINGTQQVNDGLGIKVIGELPSVKGRKWRRLKGGRGPAVLKALMAERIDGTRTALIHATPSNPPRVVMVTSADPHEGKTTTSSQLAASLARAGRRTLLIDADIRNPGVHRVFDMPLEPGLSELLRGEAERDAVVHPTRTANLWLLPAGRCDLRSVQSLSTSYLGTNIAALCVQFDYVIIDSGPVLKVADSLLVGQHVDAAILSVLKDSSNLPHVYEACERLRSVGISVLGAVINGVNDDAAQHGVELLMSEATA
ncbi:MAG: polysaccharide biosynthesis tyrosine autokinase [Pirellulales bacterium]